MATHLASVTLFTATVLGIFSGAVSQQCQCPCGGSTGRPWPGSLGAGGAASGGMGAGGAASGGMGAGGAASGGSGAASMFGAGSGALTGYKEGLERIQKEFKLTWEPPGHETGLDCVGLYLNCIRT